MTGSIPGLDRSPGEGRGCPLQYSWVSLVAQLVKNPPAVWETWVWSAGEGKGCPLQYSGLKNSMDCIDHGVSKSQTRLSNFHLHFTFMQSKYCPHRGRDAEWLLFILAFGHEFVTLGDCSMLSAERKQPDFDMPLWLIDLKSGTIKNEQLPLSGEIYFKDLL